MHASRERPILRAHDDVLSPDLVAALLEAVATPRLDTLGIAAPAGSAGVTAEVPVDSHPALQALAARLTELIGLQNAIGSTFRFRHASRGDFHPMHLDDYELDGASLVATALVYLTVCDGGPTRFPNAEPSLDVRPSPGRVLMWMNVGPDGRADLSSRHAMGPVIAGQRVTLSWFVYATPDALAHAAAEARAAGSSALVAAYLPAPRRDPAHALTVLIEAATPDTTRASLRNACARLGVGHRELVGSSVDPRAGPLEPGSLLFRPATSLSALRAERQLWQPGVATFHPSAAGPFAIHVDQWVALSRAGLPTPRSLRLDRSDADFLKSAVEWLGGLPVVIRVDDGEGGNGVCRADTFQSLRSLADLFVARHMGGQLASFVPDAMHWRLVVVGDRVVTAYKNPVRADDFRSEPSDNPADYGLVPPPEMAELAVAAARVAGTEFAGVDVIAHPSGRLYVLEANTPCYFPQGETFGTADVSGAMVTHLLAKARDLARG